MHPLKNHAKQPSSQRSRVIGNHWLNMLFRCQQESNDLRPLELVVASVNVF